MLQVLPLGLVSIPHLLPLGGDGVLELCGFLYRGRPVHLNDLGVITQAELKEGRSAKGVFLGDMRGVSAGSVP